MTRGDEGGRGGWNARDEQGEGKRGEPAEEQEGELKGFMDWIMAVNLWVSNAWFPVHDKGFPSMISD